MGTQEALSQRHYRLNFAVCLIDAGGFNLGVTFISISTIVPLFVHQLTDSNVLVGLGHWFS